MTKTFVPIYEKDEDKFFIIAPDFVGKSSEEARQIGLGSMLVECILWGIDYTGEVREIDPDNIPHRKASLGTVGTVGVISGPLFDSAAGPVE